MRYAPWHRDRLGRSLSWALLVGLASGCGSARRREPALDIVRSVRFSGNELGPLAVDTDSALRGLLETEDSPLGTLVPIIGLFRQPRYFDPSLLANDVARIQTFYAHNGWFDARVDGWSVEQLRPPKLTRSRLFKRRGLRKKSGILSVVGHVNPGPRSLVRTFAIQGGVGPSLRTQVNLTRRTSGVALGEPFSLAEVYETRSRLVHRLQDNGYAFARVESTIEVYPEERAVDVTLRIEAGPMVRFGSVNVVGTEDVPVEFLKNALPFSSGDLFRVSELEAARQRLNAFETFSVVTVKPAEKLDSEGTLPVQIDLTESSFRRARLGLSMDWNGYLLVPRVTGTMTHVNLFKRLVKLETTGDVGFAQLYQNLGSARARQLLYGGATSFRVPQFIFPAVELVGSIGVDRDLQAGQFIYFRPEADLSASIRLSDHWTLSTGPHYEYYRLPQFVGNETPLQVRALFGRRFNGQYRLATSDFRLTMDHRDDPISATRGIYLDLGLRQSMPFSAQDFNYLDLTVDGRLYLSLRSARSLIRSEASPGFPWVLALHGRARGLHAWNTLGLPYPERVFMGGSTDIRGFRDGQVGPYNTLCVYSPGAGEDGFSGLPGAGLTATQLHVPVGSRWGLNGSFEARWTPLTMDSVSVVPFVDVALLGADSGPVFRSNVGLGLRYLSPIGPIRLDFTSRGMVPEDHRPEQYVGCVSDDQLARPFGLGTGFRSQKTREYPDRPRVFQLFVGIGEAF